jgi:hypothetical protein
MQDAMPSKVRTARRKGLLHRIVREVKIAAAFVLSAMLSYCGLGDLTAQHPPVEMSSP